MGASHDLDAILERLRAEDLESASPEVLGSDLVELRRRIDWLEVEWARRVAAFDRAQGRDLEGHTSTTAFLKHRCQMAAGRAQLAVALGHRLPALSHAEKALVAGEVSLDQVRLMASVPERLSGELSDFEVTLVNGLAGLSVAQSRGLLDYWQSAIDAPGTETDAEEMASRRYFFASKTLDGMVKGDFLLDPEAGEVVLTALTALTPPRREGDDRTPGQRRADALVDMARSVLGSGVAPGTVKPHLLVLTDIDALCGHGGGTHETVSGVVLTPGQTRQLACDCAISRVVLGPDSQPLDIGRASRIVPSAMARAVIARDRHCQHPGCDRPARWCDIHHIVHWVDGGPTAISNLILLCRYHHTLEHRREARQDEPKEASNPNRAVDKDTPRSPERFHGQRRPYHQRQ